MALKEKFQRFQCAMNRNPWLFIRQVVWVITVGWALFIAYLFAALGMVLTIVFIPFAWSAIQFAWFAFEPLTKEPYHLESSFNVKTSPWKNPKHPFTIAANVVWLIFFGWEIALLHLFAALVQVMTIINIGTAQQNVRLALFALWPFGRGIKKKFLPTTLDEMRAQKEGRPLGEVTNTPTYPVGKAQQQPRVQMMPPGAAEGAGYPQEQQQQQYVMDAQSRV